MAITQNTYTGDGATVLFSFTFEYLTESDIKITLNGTPTTAYTLATATSIQFNTAPANGVAIRIYRDTDIDTLSATFFPGSAIKAEDLNSNYTQNNYAAQEAKRESDAAVSAANSALNIVNSVLSYDPVANVAAIPAAPSDGDRVEVLDSTGIESFTPLTGVPGGFTGASTLTVRLIYSVTTWVWQDYQSTDPDSRYLKVNGDSTMTGNLVMGTNKITGLGDPTSLLDAATKKYVDDNSINNVVEDVTPQLGGNLDVNGNNITSTSNDNIVISPDGNGTVDVDLHRITSVTDPTGNQDAATKKYVDDADDLKLNLSGGTMSGDIAMNTNSITGLVDPSNSQDAATKNYVDSISGARNRIINGDFSIAQRGTSFVFGANNDDTYTLDRWYILSNGNNVIDVAQETSTVPTNQKYAIALDVETANRKFGIAQIIENVNCVGLTGNTVTLSFKAKVSSTTRLDNVKAAIVAWSGTADAVTSDIISAWNAENTNPTLIANATYENTPANLNVTTNYATYTVSAAIDTASTSNVIVFIWSDVTSTTVGDFLYITDVQLEPGSVATPFERRSYGQELALCQRYYQTGNFKFWGYTLAGGPFGGTIPFNTQMRTNPSVSTSGATGGNFSNVVVESTYKGEFVLYGTAISTGGIVFQAPYIASAEF